MSVLDKYPNLPGFTSEFKDGGLVVRTEVTPPGTDSILLLGTSIDGPVGEPVAVDASTVETVFGGSRKSNGTSNGTTLVSAFKEAFDAGCRDIRLMRISGKEARAEFPIEEEAKVVAEQVDLLIPVTDKEMSNTETEEIVKIPKGFKYVDGSAKIAELKESQYSITQTPALPDDATSLTVVINAGSVQSRKGLRMDYVAINSKEENISKYHTIIVKGEDVVFSLKEEIDAGFYLYQNGRLISNSKYKIAEDKKTITVNAGTFSPKSEVEVSYIHNASINKVHTFSIQSIFGGDTYNHGRVELELEGERLTVSITKPESKKKQVSEQPLVYTSIDYPTLEELASAINSDRANNVFRAVINEAGKGIATRQLLAKDEPKKVEQLFSGGSDGVDLSKYELFEILGGKRSDTGKVEDQGVYHLLENYTADMIVPLGVHADDKLPGKYNSFGSQLALACAVISHRNHTTTGVISTSSPDESGLSAVKDHYDHLVKHKNDYFMRDTSGHIINDPSSGKPMDLGRFVSVVAGPDVVINTDGLRSYAINSAAGYAGFISKLAPQSAPTNKVRNEVRGLRYNFSNAQLDALTEARYVTFTYKGEQGRVAVVDGPTAAQPGSDYRRVSTTRVVKEVINELRDVCDVYIGEPNEIPQRNAMSAAISKRLEQLQEAGVIVDKEFVIVSTPAMRILGEAQIELTIIPPMELRKITTIVALRPGM